MNDTNKTNPLAPATGSASLRDLRSPLAKARDEWLESDEGKRCRDAIILSSPHVTQYLENRLVLAFLAGARWAESKRQNRELSHG